MSLPHFSSKIVTIDQFLSLRRKHFPGKCVVFTNGCFDILHPGHLDYLTKARSCGDILIVALNSDASVRRIKGETRPVNGQEARCALVAGLEVVDFVTLFSEDTPLQAIRAICPDVLVKGGDWPLESIVGRDFVESRGGRVCRIPLLEGHSTSRIIQAILDKHKPQNGR
jgi:rfaE bifunctional protein nucleotidyltransferase chain/domain